MEPYRYVIVGGGMAADAALQGIRRRDRTGPILVVSDEPYPPYQRPPLSKKLWMDMRMEETWLDAWQRHSHVDLLLNTTVARLNPSDSTIATADGRIFAYQDLLLATGARPRTLPGDAREVFYVGSMREHIRLFQALSEPRRVAVIGGGFIGAEMAAALSARGHAVTWLMAEARPFASFLPDDLAERVIAEYRAHNVEILTGEEVVRMESRSGGLEAITAAGSGVPAEAAVVGIGVQLNDELARTAGLADGPGVPVDEFLKTRDPHIWAAGDVAVMAPSFRPMLHEDHALTQARMAGENMAGAAKKYTHVPFYYSDLYQVGYEAIGDCRTVHDMVQDWVVPGEEGVIYYCHQGRVVGVLIWNVWDGIPKAREILMSGHTWEPSELMGQIRNP